MTSVEPQIENHIRIMLRRWWLIVGAGLAAFIAAYVWQSSAAETFRADGVVQVRIPLDVGDDGQITEFQARSYAEAASSDLQLTQALERTDLGLDVDDAAELLDIGLLSTPGFIEVIADGTSVEAAEELVDAVLMTIVDEVETDALDLQPDEGPPVDAIEVEVVQAAHASQTAVAPRPLRAAVLAGLIASILAAELAVFIWYVRGRLSLADPAAHIRRLVDVRVIDLMGSDPDPILPFVVGQLESRPVITVLQSGKVASAAVAVQLDRALARGGRRVMTFDAGSEHPEMRLTLGGEKLAAQLERTDGPNEYDPRVLDHLVNVMGAQTTLVSATTATNQEGAFDTVRQFPDAVILVVDPTKTNKLDVTRQTESLRDVGAVLLAIFLHPEPRRPLPFHLADHR